MREQITLSELCQVLGWRSDDGPTMGVWSSRPAGHKCVWSCLWNTAGGLLYPGEYVRLDTMSPDQLAAELQDCLDRGDNGMHELSAIYPFRFHVLDALIGDPSRFSPQKYADYVTWARGMVGKCRPYYKEYTAFWCAPGKMWRDERRPGWPESVGAHPVVTLGY